ncbi:DUF6188 family protein [Microbacterium karelineae]|uniref:DUF6188 family protein n=1 Tax=Microbacterium karelineae TaxID=2654283 RepID=UPI0012E9B20E|nr:DUF6188 family protein [Microbacterium karelineae]
MIDISKVGDRWVLPVVGQLVAQVSVDYAVTLCLINNVAVRIEQQFVISTKNGEEYTIIPAGDLSQLAPVLTLARSILTEGFAFEDGHLELVFNDGARVFVPSSQDYEPWEIVGPAHMRIISAPGGELSVWLPNS